MAPRCCETGHHDPATPTRAGSGLSRRSFLLGGIGLSLTMFGGRALAPGAVDDGLLAAAEAASGHRVVVAISLSGGVDGLSLLPPVTDPKYRKALRPSLWVDPAQTGAVAGTDALRWHPLATDLRGLHDSGRLLLFPAIGYEGPNQSHFTSRHFYEVGATDVNGATGWMGRYLDIVGSAHNPVQGLTIGSLLSPMLAPAHTSVATIDTPSAYDFTTPGLDGGPFKDAMVDGFKALGQLTSDDPILGPARAAQRDAAAVHTSLHAGGLGAGGPGYPDGPLATRLQDLARLLGAGLPIRCASLDSNLDFDTHANQGTVAAGADGTFGRNVVAVGAALKAFQADLEARGVADRVLTLVWSEFGRRPEENGSQGTDHGAGGLAMLMGTRVRAGLQGEFVPLGNLDPDGNLRSSTDFRALYSSILEQWLDQDARDVIPGAAALGRYPLLRSA